MTRLCRRSLPALLAYALLSTALPALAEPDHAQEVERLLHEIREQRLDLERRTHEIEARERGVAKLEREVEERIVEFESLRSSLELRLERVEQSLGDEISRLAKTYASMEPQSAAQILQRLDAELASSLLRRMKAKKSAAILTSLPRSRAEMLSRMLARPFDVGGTGGLGAKP